MKIHNHKSDNKTFKCLDVRLKLSLISSCLVSTVKSTELILSVATCFSIFWVRKESRYFLFSSLGDLERDNERYY